MHLLDTPGVLPPRIESVETGMKLALCGESKYDRNRPLLIPLWRNLHNSIIKTE